MKGFLFDVEVMWGYETRLAGMAKTAPSFRFPPPTTILGALAFAYARRKGYGEAESYETISQLAAGTLALSYRPLNSQAISFQDINRILAIRTPHESKQDLSIPPIQRIYKYFDAPATGKTSLSYVGEGKGVPSLRVIIVVKDSLDIRQEDIWSIYRIGSKESLACVTRVVQCKPLVNRERVKTNYLFPEVPGISEISLEGEPYAENYVPVPYVVSNGPHTAGVNSTYGDSGLPDAVTSMVIDSRTVLHKLTLPGAFRGRAHAELSLDKPYVGYSCEGEVVVGIEDSY